jgi:Transposase
VGNASGVFGGDRNRNARLARLRALVPLENAIVGIDLADMKQMVVVTDHDSRVLARRRFCCRGWDLGAALDWAAGRAAAKGWAGVRVACEPTGHRWRVVGQLAADRGMPMVCVQPLQMSWARRSEDLTFDKTEDNDGCGGPAAAARGHHHRPSLGPQHRRARNQTPQAAGYRGLTTRHRGLRQAGGRGEPSAALRHHVISTHIMGSPARGLLNPITRCWAQPHHRYAGTDDGRGTDQTLDANRLTLM